MSFQQYIDSIAFSLEDASLEKLDLLTAYYLGVTKAKPNSPLAQELGNKINTLYVKKRGLEFIHRILVISGSNQLTPGTKEKLLSSTNPLQYIKRINEIVGKNEGTTQLSPFDEHLLDSAFHEEFLSYESKAHYLVVGALIERLEFVIEKMSREIPVVIPSKKNTLLRLYQGNNVGKTFISIDLRQANWTSLRHWDPTLPTWDNFLEPLLPEGELKSLFLASKNFRQVTLGVALKKYNAVKMVEATQVMLIKQATETISKKLGQPFSESNDEMIFEWKHSFTEKWLTTAIKDPLLRLTRFYIREKTHDDCFVIDYEEIGTNRKYTLLRCTSPEKVEARMSK